MKEKRIIKKYPNRRLYDTVDSRYITIDNVRELVMKNIDFCVVDKKSGDDITRSILLQIIMEQEDDHQPIFTAEVLAKIIRLYGEGVQDIASNFFERSFSMFTEQQDEFNHRMKEAIDSNPLTTMAEMTKKNMQIWQKMQDDFFKIADRTTSEKKSKD